MRSKRRDTKSCAYKRKDNTKGRLRRDKRSMRSFYFFLRIGHYAQPYLRLRETTSKALYPFLVLIFLFSFKRYVALLFEKSWSISCWFYVVKQGLFYAQLVSLAAHTPFVPSEQIFDLNRVGFCMRRKR